MTEKLYVKKSTNKIPTFLFSLIPNKYTSEIYLNLLLLKSQKMEADVIEYSTGRKAIQLKDTKRCYSLGITNLNRGIYKVRIRNKKLKMAYVFEFAKR